MLAVPGVRAQVVSGYLAQVTQQAAPVGAVLVVHAATGSLALAGLVVAAFSVGFGIARPLQGRAIDRIGARPVCLASGVLHVGALVGLAACATPAAPRWVLVLLGGAAGLGLPPVSQCMRVDWGRRTAAEHRTAAYSLVYLTQELAILTGPLLLGAALVLRSAASALMVVAIAAGVGTVAFAYVLRVDRPVGHAAPRGGALREGGMRILLVVVALLGGTIGALEVGLPALATAHGVAAASGLLIAAVSLGGIVGAAGYGVRRWAAPPAARLVALLLALGLLLAPAFAVGPLPLVGLVLFVAGTTLNPAMTTASLLVDDLAPSAPGEAFGWISTALGIGAAGGGALTGVLGQHGGPAPAFVLASLFALLAALLGTLTRGQLDRVTQV